MSDETEHPAKPVLDRADLASHTWRKLKEHMEALLEKQRRANDNKKLDDVETAYLRGQIGAFKNLIALSLPQPEAPVDSPDADE